MIPAALHKSRSSLLCNILNSCDHMCLCLTKLFQSALVRSMTWEVESIESAEWDKIIMYIINWKKHCGFLITESLFVIIHINIRWPSMAQRIMSFLLLDICERHYQTVWNLSDKQDAYLDFSDFLHKYATLTRCIWDLRNAKHRSFQLTTLNFLLLCHPYFTSSSFPG
jgi:hypothetical protein